MKAPTPSLPTMSKLPLVDECPPSWVLPAIRETHDAADEGNDLHDALRSVVDCRRPNSECVHDPGIVTPWLEAVAELLGNRLDHSKSEAAYAYDTATGAARLLGFDLGRNYGQTPTEVAGAADYVVEGEDVVDVYDLKTGLAPHEELAHHAQMRALACAVGLTHNKRVRTWLIVAPRDGQRPHLKRGPEYGAFDLLELGEWLRGIAARLDEARRTPDARKRYSVGRWCANCRARLNCPTQVEMLRRLAKDPDGVAGDLASQLVIGPTEARLAYNRLKAAKKALGWVEGQLHAWIKENGPIQLASGKVFGPHQTTTETFNPEITRTWLEERFGAAEALKAMTLKTSKTAVGRIVEANTPRGKKTTAVDAALAELRAIPGCVVTKTETTTEEHTPPRAAITTGQETP